MPPPPIPVLEADDAAPARRRCGTRRTASPAGVSRKRLRRRPRRQSRAG
jgi:hypothetical protein